MRKTNEDKKGKLYTVEEDEEGYQVVKRYHIKWTI